MVGNGGANKIRNFTSARFAGDAVLAAAGAKADAAGAVVGAKVGAVK